MKNRFFLRSDINRYFESPKTDYSILFSPRLLIKNYKMHALSGQSDHKHIFVMGAPRNGTTLLQKILCGHTHVVGPDAETFFFCRRRFDNFNEVIDIEGDYDKLFWESNSKIELFDAVASTYVKSDNKIFLEKTPEHAIYLNHIARFYPKSCIIFVYRDGRDAFVSARQHPGVNAKMGRKYPYVWRDSVRRYISEKGRANVLGVRYEDFCSDPKSELKRILEFCGLPFDSELIRPEIYSQTKFSRVREHYRLNEPITSKTVGIYRKPENTEDSIYFQRVAGEELRALGYQVVST